MRLFSQVLVVGACMVAAYATTAQASDSTYVISVSGVGEVKVEPDMAYLTVGITTQAKVVSEAQSQNSTATANVNQVLHEVFKLTDQDVKTTSYNVSPMYEYPQNSQPVLVGYSVKHTLQVRVKDLSRLGDIIDAVGRVGATDLGSVTFSTSKRKQLELEALALAYADAQSKAEVLAKAAARTLVRAVRISQSSVSYSPVRAEAANSRAAGAPMPSPTTLSGGELTISASVSVDYQF